MAHATMETPKKEMRGRKKLHHLRIHPMDGGQMITHHAVNREEYGTPYEEKPYKTHLFGKGESEAMMEHVRKHAKAEMAELEGDEVGKEEDGE